jgi:hypothetical protein
MDYQKHYNKLMESRLLSKPERYQKRKTGEYYEGHHIIPKNKGGEGTSNRGLNHPNIVLLTAREHFLAHWLLWRIYGDRVSALAFHKMMSSNKNQNRIVSSRGYEEARLAFSETNKGNQYGKGKTRIVTEEQKKKHSELMKGRYSGENNPYFGKTHSDESKKMISEKAKARPIETRSGYKGLKIVIKDGIVVGEFKESKDIAKFIGCSHSNIRHVLAGHQKSAKGYNIEYNNLLNGSI